MSCVHGHERQSASGEARSRGSSLLEGNLQRCEPLRQALAEEVIQSDVDDLVSKACEMARVLCVVQWLRLVLMCHGALHKHDVVHHIIHLVQADLQITRRFRCRSCPDLVEKLYVTPLLRLYVNGCNP